MDFLPLFHSLQGRLALVVGGGEVALRKARLLADAGARLRVVAPQIHIELRHLVEQGSDGLLVCGTTGESPTLSWDEQLQLLQAVREAVGSDAKVLAGTGSNSTAEAVEATKEAAAAGADGGRHKVPGPV